MRLLLFLLVPTLASASIVTEIKAAVAAQQFAAAESLLNQTKPRDAEWIEAYSWLARGHLNAKRFDTAQKYAANTRTYVAQELKKRPLDQEPHLPVALGAAIEVDAQALAGKGERAEAVSLLRAELAKYRNTSIQMRIQKNINLLSLEGKPAPVFAVKGKPTLLFFWAHWCGDCKAQGPIIADLRKRHPGLQVITPTQHYGYAEKGRDVGPAEETRYINTIRHQFYPQLLDAAAPIDEETFKLYGVSTTPTLVLVDSKGIVRMYHPGRMTMEELETRVSALR